MVCGNSGRPGGSVGDVLVDRYDEMSVDVRNVNVNPRHQTQEEDCVSNFLLTMKDKNRKYTFSQIWDAAVNPNGPNPELPNFWGMKVPKLKKEHCDWSQGFEDGDDDKKKMLEDELAGRRGKNRHRRSDVSRRPSDWFETLEREVYETWQLAPTYSYKMERDENHTIYEDAWVVGNANLSAKTGFGYDGDFDKDQTFLCDLIFVAGPNARDPQGKTMYPDYWSSMRRTANPKTFEDDQYQFFKDCVKSSIRAALLAMIIRKNNIAVLGGVSTGLYAGVHHDAVNDPETGFASYVREVLEENVKKGSNVKIGQFFHEVVYPQVPPPELPRRSSYSRSSTGGEWTRRHHSRASFTSYTESHASTAKEHTTFFKTRTKSNFNLPTGNSNPEITGAAASKSDVAPTPANKSSNEPSNPKQPTDEISTQKDGEVIDVDDDSSAAANQLNQQNEAEIASANGDAGGDVLADSNMETPPHDEDDLKDGEL